MSAKTPILRRSNPLSAYPDTLQLSGNGKLMAVTLHSGGVAHYTKGGLAAKADAVKNAGRYGDSRVVHVNDDELAQMRQMWGNPTTNPKTGQPEFFLGGIGDFLKNILMGGASSILGQKSPLVGGILGSLLAPGSEAPPTAATAATPAAAPTVPSGGSLAPPTAPTTQAKPSFWNQNFLGIKGLPNKFGIPLAGLAVYSMLHNSNGEDQSGGINAGMNADQLIGAKLQPTFKGSLPGPSGFYQNLSPIAKSEQQAYGGNAEQRYFNYAKGGRTSFAVKGPGTGRSDDIPAMLSDGEYVVDADTVAMLGNGSSKAGADALDKLRVNIRKHKGRNMARGRMGASAKAPEHYLRGGRT